MSMWHYGSLFAHLCRESEQIMITFGF